MDAALVIMAAGMASRYGGIKQLEGVGPNGEFLMEYSIYDAVRSGFSKIVFIIKEDFLPVIKSMCGDRVQTLKTASGKPVKVEYVFQDFSSIPSFYKIPKDRTKPFGTVHAVLCAKNVISEPFAVINADDYYGTDAYRTMFSALSSIKNVSEAVMVSYKLKNTVSEFGAVTRGICKVENGMLSSITETYKIKLFPDQTIRDTASDLNGIVLDPESSVSMNIWGFSPEIFSSMEEYFHSFLNALPENELAKECLLPIMVDNFISSRRCSVSVLDCNSRWFGMTYKEDRAIVAQELLKLHNSGIYPKSLKE